MKAVILLCLVGVAFCAPQLSQQTGPTDEETIEPFNFSLIVNDDENTVYATRQESQDQNGAVQGEYSWVAPNGVRYTTTYTADPVNGYNAVTREEQTNIVVKIPVHKPQEQSVF
ncbi:pupal cuticle protein Edg-84A-like [Palaemon carinicauda]|uniref:pupal cuticle protein Edg-84A-like n=1 Tax=Macrobrachium nipponense TaxID=159736 RepID=UPI0030C8B12C